MGDREIGLCGRMVIFTGLPGSGKTTMAKKLAAEMPACRMCPDDWMRAAGIDLWDASARSKIEAVQLTLALELLRAGTQVIIDWGGHGTNHHHRYCRSVRRAPRSAPRHQARAFPDMEDGE